MAGVGKGHLIFEPDRCVRTLSTHSNCERCAEACPHSAITLSGPPTDQSKDCDGCGLCAVACPTDAITLGADDPILALDRLPKGCSELEITCRRKGNEGAEAGLTVECIGVLDEWFFLSGLSVGIISFQLAGTNCVECDRASEVDQIRSAVERFQPLVMHLPEQEQPSSRKRDSKVAETGAHLSRRGFLFDFSDSFKGLAGGSAQGSAVNQPGKEASSRRLKEVVGSKSVPINRRLGLVAVLSVGVPYVESYDWVLTDLHEVKLDPSLCDMCGQCATLCPTGALSLEIRDETMLLQQIAARCCGCRLCVDICHKEAVDLKKATDLDQVMFAGPLVVHEVSCSTCETCGDAFPNKNTKQRICNLCEKTLEIEVGFFDMLGNSVDKLD